MKVLELKGFRAFFAQSLFARFEIYSIPSSIFDYTLDYLFYKIGGI
jgi:hypothetical protein